MPVARSQYRNGLRTDEGLVHYQTRVLSLKGPTSASLSFSLPLQHFNSHSTGMKSALLATAVLSSGSALAASNYSLVKEYSGQNFFDGWVFYDYYDNTTSGAYPSRVSLSLGSQHYSVSESSFWGQRLRLAVRRAGPFRSPQYDKLRRRFEVPGGLGGVTF